MHQRSLPAPGHARAGRYGGRASSDPRAAAGGPARASWPSPRTERGREAVPGALPSRRYGARGADALHRPGVGLPLLLVLPGLAAAARRVPGCRPAQQELALRRCRRIPLHRRRPDPGLRASGTGRASAGTDSPTARHRNRPRADSGPGSGSCRAPPTLVAEPDVSLESVRIRRWGRCAARQWSRPAHADRPR